MALFTAINRHTKGAIVSAEHNRLTKSKEVVEEVKLG